MNERECSTNRLSKQQASATFDSYFDHNQPRPPIPGEERAHYKSDWGQMDIGKQKILSPVPKRHNESAMGYEHEPPNCKMISYHPSRQDKLVDTRLSSENVSPPACLQWATSISQLLGDPDGVKLFKRYLQEEGKQHSDVLDFWIICEGLRNQDEIDRQELVKVIYKRFFLKPVLPIANELREEIDRRVEAAPLNESVVLLDEAQAQVENLMNSTTYPSFLKSDTYVQYVRSFKNSNTCEDMCSESSSPSSFVTGLAELNMASSTGPLPIIHEDMEFVSKPMTACGLTPGTGYMSTGYQSPNLSTPVRLTKDALLVTQNMRIMEVRPRPEAYADNLFIKRGINYHRTIYNSYNPVSRQDSERQSMSSHSDARTDSDNMSMSSCSIPVSKSKSHSLESRQAKEQAALNRETDLRQTIIPRTQRIDPKKANEMNAIDFAAVLTAKLEKVLEKQNQRERLDRKLKELEYDDDQDILDQHVSRVFSDQTSMTPPGMGPRSHSPSLNRFSMFSGDSGNIHDFSESFDHRSMVKSKSMPEYSEERDRFIRGSTGRRSASKTTLNYLTDSGVSVLSDTLPSSHNPQSWTSESYRSGRGIENMHGEMIQKHKGHKSSSTMSPNAARHKKAYGPRFTSTEQTCGVNMAYPKQPFVADPNMPPLPLPNTDTWLEESRRRLMEDDALLKSRQRNSSKCSTDLSQSNQSTLRKSMRGMKSTQMQDSIISEEVTVVLYSFCDEKYLYRTKIPGKQITLRQFKDYLPKKGNYRYFFKTECEELNGQPINEEVSNDNEVLPTFEGKIMAQVKVVE